MNTNLPTVLRALAVACLCSAIGQLHGALRYTAPFGPGGTWNVYEPVDTPTTFWLAHQAATQAVYLGVSGHLVTIGSKEEDLAVGRMAGRDIWIGLTDQAQLGGAETGTNPNVAKWGGWLGDVNDIPLNVRPLVQPNGWVWITGEPYAQPYNYQAWDAGEPNNFGAGEGGVRRRNSGFWNDDGIGAFGQSASTAGFVIEYDLGSLSPSPATLELDRLFPANRLPGPEGGPGGASITVFRTGRPFDDVEPVVASLAINELTNPFYGTAPTINFHDPQSGGGGLFPSGRLTFPGNTAADDNDFQVLIKGAIEVPAGQSGTWTFNVHADDGFAFQINGAEFTSAHGNGYLDFADRSTLSYPEPTGDANTRGVIDLQPGVYPFQFVMYELGGGAFCELSAAPGAQTTDASTTQWRLVNSATSPLKFVALPPPPAITQQPVSTNVIQGTPVTLTLLASGTPPLSYKWRLNGASIPSATSANFFINSTQQENAGDYTVVVSNPSGSVTSQVATLTVGQNQPDLVLNIGPSTNGVWLLNLGTASPPVRVEFKRNLDDPWEGWLTTFLNDLPIQPTGDSAFFRARPIEIPLETDDDGTGRSEVAQFYERSPQHYWVHFGIPPLARLSDINEAAGRNPQDSFAGLNRGFDARRFHTAFQGGLLAAEFTKRLTFFLESGQGTNEAVNSSFRFFVTELDSVYEAQGTNAPRIEQIFGMFNGVFSNSYNVANLAVIAPLPEKQGQFPATTNLGWVDLHGSDAFTLQVPPLPPNLADTDTSSRIRWKDIRDANWNTTYNGACAAVATGASLAKLAPEKFPASTTCQFWNEFSRGIGNQAGSVGATANGMANYYATLGYQCVTAKDGVLETAVEEADKAWKRGCDVTLHYLSADGKEAHIEMVELIVLDPNNSQRATVHTLSWGQHESVTYDNGTWSGKSDGNRYGSENYLQDSGKATFYYYCKE